MKAIVILPSKNGRGFDLFDYLVDELNAHGIEARVFESETDTEQIKGPRVGVYNALPGPFAKGGK